MSENKDDSTENSEKEPDVIYVQYDGDLNAENQNIIIQIREEGSHINDKNENIKNSQQNSVEIIEEIDSPDLVDIDDYKNSNTYENSEEAGDDSSTAVLCETSLEPDATVDLTAVQKGDDIKFFQLVNVEENVNIIEDIPNEVLVYTCQPLNDEALNRYPCKTCGIVVGCIFCLKSHYESIHLNLGIIQYKCDQTSYLKNYIEICHKCNLVCESKEEMFDHRKIHFVSCDVCDMSFDSALFLSNHCKTAHEKFEVIISCDLCEHWFKQLQDLSEHYESYHEMILCIVCFKRFATTAEMEEHHGTHKIVMKHTAAVLPYACSKCNEAFAEISDLSTHLTKKHPKRKVYQEVQLPIPKSKKKYKNKRTIRFDDCGGLSQELIVEETEEEETRKIQPDV